MSTYGQLARSYESPGGVGGQLSKSYAYEGSGVYGQLAKSYAYEAPLIGLVGYPSELSDPGDLILMGAQVTVPGVTVDTWVWTQTGGVPVVLRGSGSSRDFDAPGTLTGTTITVLVTAQVAGQPDVSITITQPILAHAGGWGCSATGQLVAVITRIN